MTTKIVTGVIDSATLASFGQAGPAIANVQIANSSYSQIDDTAISLSGGYIIINGNNFSSNVQVLIDGTTATSVTYVSNTQLRAEIGSSTSGSKVVYVINNNDGSTAIRVNGITYSEFPTWITDTSLGTQDSGSAIAISFSANSDSNVTYSVAAGSSLPTGLSLASNGYLSGTVTVSSLTVYNFTILATDTENQDSSKAFSLTISSGDLNIADVIALLQTDKDAYTIDASTNQYVVTENGDVKPTSFSPYRGSYYSNFFDGADYLTVADDASLEFGSSEFTIEMWVNALSSGQTGIFSTRVNSSAYGPLNLDYNGGTLRLLSSSTGNSWHDISGGSISFNTNQWNHIAITREVNTLKIWVNGALSKTISVSGALMENTAGLAIGSRFTSGGDTFPGYISNFRIVIGTALYTAAFTPPTSPLTTTSQGATASEVSLLTCQSSRFIDNSTNGHTITVVSDPAVSGHSPFAANSSYADYGSGYFDGTGDYLTVPSGSHFANFGTDDFTIEWWEYITAWSGQYFAIMHYGALGATGNFLAKVGIRYESSGSYIRLSIGGSTYDFTGLSTPLKVWRHCAIVRSGTTVKLYRDGIEEANSKTISTDITEQNGESIIGGAYFGGGGGVLYSDNGYLSNLRVVKGTAVYTASFTPPTEPLTAITNTSLLTLQTNNPTDSTIIRDKSGGEMPLTVNGDINTSSFSPYSPFGYSNYFDGTGDYLVVPANNDFLFDAGDFTIEAWIHPNITNTTTGIVNNWQSGGAFIFFILNDNRLRFQFNNVPSGVSSVLFTSTDTISPDVWSHVAVVRSGSSLYFFINGTLDSGGAQTITDTMYYFNGAAKDLKIGTGGDTGSLWNGYISNLRIIKGTGLYTSAFTPSTAALTPTDKTVLLTCQSPSFIDNGKKKHSLTRFGDARVTPYAPFKGHTITPDSHGVYFDGTGDYLTSTPPSLGSENFTIECWIHPTDRPATDYNFIFDTRPSGSNDGFSLWVVQSSGYLGLFDGPANVFVNSTTVVPLNQWSHVALVRNGSDLRAYLNGVSVASRTTSSGVNSSSLYVGTARDNPGSTRNFAGYISNFRIIKGTALYTSAFTPSTSPLTTTSQSATASEVSLLTCQSSTLIDNSSSNRTITAFGNIQPAEFNPFGFTTISNVQYNPTTHAGSMYGDGTTDYVDVPANAWNSVGTGDFCIQFWTYSKEVDANKGQIAVGGNKIAIRFDTSNRMTFWVAGNGGPTSTPNNTVYPFNWYHVCLERSGSTNTLYINGVAQATNTTTPSNDATPIIRIGGQYADNTGYTFTGWISDLSIRSKAVYKGNFVPPKQVTYGDQTKLQVPFSDAAIYDAKSQLTYEVNSLKTSSKVTKFNNQSLSFAGVNDYVYTEERHGTVKVYGKQLKLSTNDFTVEFWVNFNSLSGRQDILWVGTSTRLGILYNLNANELTYYAINESAITANPSFSTNTWYHVALSRYNGSTKLFVNGTQLGSTYSDSKNYDESILYIGRDSGAASSWFNGYLDNIRITKAGRYTSNFTAPTENFSKK
jgi:hypothetical protein